MIPSQFDDIRPFIAEELPMVYAQLLGDETFLKVVAAVFPSVPIDAIKEKMYACKSLLDFQKAFFYDIVQMIMARSGNGFQMEAPTLQRNANYTFVSNHRDIVLDSAMLDVLLIDNKFSTTCEIAIGDNLLKAEWIKAIVRLNKSFIVKRGLPMRQMLQASRTLSDYMHYAIKEKQENVWIAQREGRAKDSDDRTAEAILKMMTMGGEGTIVERLKALNIVPLSISYEYDPCDYLKAKEFQQRRDTPDFKKGANDDLVSMQTGITGYKGNVRYYAASSINAFLDELSPDMPKTELYRMIAEHIDHEIHLHYHLFATNYIALDLLQSSTDFSDKYSQEEKAHFETYLQQQIDKIDLPEKDEAYLRERILTMYANPAINHLRAIKA